MNYAVHGTVPYFELLHRDSRPEQDSLKPELHHLSGCANKAVVVVVAVRRFKPFDPICARSLDFAHLVKIDVVNLL